MKNKVTKALIFLSLISILIACNTKKTGSAGTAVDKEQIKKEIQAKENEFAATYNSGEMKNIGYYAEDATTFAQNNPPVVGREAILEYLKANIDSLDKSNKITFTTKEVFVSNDGNQVVEIGYYQVFDSTNTPVNVGNYMSLFEKRDGRYYSVRDMSASDGSVK
jgi:ketosteroid isomerase-like protein